MSGYAKCFDETKYINFFIEVKTLLKAFNQLWKKISHLMKKGSEKEPVYDEKYLRTEIKSYDSTINLLW